MSDQNQARSQATDDFLNNENFKSCFARSVVVNSHFKHAKAEGNVETTDCPISDSIVDIPSEPTISQETPVRFRKNASRNSSVDDSRRFSCGSIVSRRVSMNGIKKNDVPVECIYNQRKIDTLQWQLRETEKSREMYKAVTKQVVTFLEKAHISLESLGDRLNSKNSVPRSKSEHHLGGDTINNSSASQRLLVEEHLSSWSSNKKELHPEEIPPQKLAQEAFRLLRTVQSLLKTQEPNLAVADGLYGSDEPSDIEFLAQLAKEFPSDMQKPQRATSFSLTPKLILPEHDVRISTAFNRKLSLQLNEVKWKSGQFSRCDSARGSVTESECLSLPGVDRLGSEAMRDVTGSRQTRNKIARKTSSSPASGSVSSMEDESGFSSLTSFQDVGLPLVNSTATEEVSPRTLFLKSVLHDGDQSTDESESTLRTSPPPATRYQKKSEYKKRELNTKDVKLWQKSTPKLNEPRFIQNPKAISPFSHKNPDAPATNSLKVLWV